MPTVGVSSSANVACIVVHYGATPTLTGRCVRSLLAATESRESLTIFVVDNQNAGTQLAAAFADIQEASIELVVPPCNLGYSGGVNLAMRAAMRQGAEFILIANPDITMTPPALDRMLGHLTASDKIGCVGPRLVFPDGSHQSAAARLTSITGRPVEIGAKRRRTSRSLDYVTALSGACVLFRTRTLEDVGLFDELYFCYWEEADWFARVAHTHWQVAMADDATVVHLQGGSRPLPFMLFEYTYNWRLFVRKHRRGVRKLLAALVVTLVSIRRVLTLSFRMQFANAAAVAIGIITPLPRSAAAARARAYRLLQPKR